MDGFGSPAAAIAVEAGMDIVVSLAGSAVNLDISPFLYESL